MNPAFKSGDRDALRELTKDQLIDLILEQSKRIAALARQVEQQGERIKELEKAAARTAAPFSKGEGKKKKKKPGRKKGQGPFSNRKEPDARPSDVINTTVVKLGERACAGCGGGLEIAVEVCTTTDVPEEPQRRIERFEVECGTCPACGRKTRGEHPDLPRGQHGATAHRVGERVVAQALAMHYHSGMTLRKAAEATAIITDISITQSALTQRAGELCKEGAALGKIYQGLRAGIRDAAVVNTDDTGWRTGGKPSYLMGFFTPGLAVYQVRARHRHEEVVEMIGELFWGILGTDRGPSYEAGALDGVLQQKCLSHLLKNLSEVEKTKRGRALSFTRGLKKTLREGLELWHEHRDGKLGWNRFRKRGKKLEEKLDHQLRERVLSDADNQRMLEGIRKQHESGRVLLFLEIPEVEPTNNRAERGLRSAVIARKVSQCSKNETGAGIYEAMKSITATLKLRGYNVAKALADLMVGGSMPPALTGR
ncbi:MAG: transposase [bacterium]|nr:transposase [bacterium]